MVLLAAAVSGCLSQERANLSAAVLNDAGETRNLTVTVDRLSGTEAETVFHRKIQAAPDATAGGARELGVVTETPGTYQVEAVGRNVTHRTVDWSPETGPDTVVIVVQADGVVIDLEGA